MRRLLLMLLCAGCPPHQTQPTEAAWDLLMDQVDDDSEVTLDQARAAFVLAIGPLPGVPTPPGTLVPLYDGTLAINWMLSYYDQLTPDQRDTFDRFCRAPAVPNPALPRFEGFVISRSQMIAAKTGFTMLWPDTVINGQDIDPNDEVHAVAYACPKDDPAHPDRYVSCEVHFNPRFLDETDDAVAETAAHEAFHCYQAWLMPTLTKFRNVRRWLAEGSAEWAGAAINGTAEFPRDDHNAPGAAWHHCLTEPTKSLYDLKRGYDGICFFAEMEAQARSPWKYIDAIYAGWVVNGPEGAFLAGAGGPYFFDHWAPAYVRDPSLGPDWNLTGPGITSDRLAVTAIAMANGNQANDTLPPVSNNDYLLKASADVLIVRAPAHSRLLSKSGNGTTSPNGDWCVNAASCDCPAGTPWAGAHLPPLPADDYYFAVSGGLKGADWWIGGMTLDDYCKRDRVDPCLVGSWVLQSSGPQPLSTAVTCTIPQPFGTVATFNADGSASEDFEHTATMTCYTAGGTAVVTMRGQDSEQVTADHGSMSVTNIDTSGVIVRGMVVGLDVSVPFGLGAAGDTAVTYRCTSSTLTIDNPATGMTYNFTR